jgi:uncharacterized protein (DUF58 family)
MDTDFFRELERFSLLVKKRVSTTYSGGRKSLRLGHGISPVGYREYKKGDDFKLIDWKVYARTEKLYIREHEEERSLLIQILLDASGSMALDKKFIYASQIAAGFAYLAIIENEKFSISLFCKALYPGEPMSGRRHLIHTINELDSVSPRGQANFKKITTQFEAIVRSTSLVVLISDLLGDTESIVSSIYRLSEHELIVIRVSAPSENELDFRGDIKFVDMETHQPLITRVTEGERMEYKRKLDEHISKITVACNSVGADFFDFKTDKPIFDAFSEMVSKSIVWRT